MVRYTVVSAYPTQLVAGVRRRQPVIDQTFPLICVTTLDHDVSSPSPPRNIFFNGHFSIPILRQNHLTQINYDSTGDDYCNPTHIRVDHVVRQGLL